MDIPSLPFSDPHHSILMSSIHSSNPAEGAPITEPQIIDKTGEDMDNGRTGNDRSKEEETEVKLKKKIAGGLGRVGPERQNWNCIDSFSLIKYISKLPVTIS